MRAPTERTWEILREADKAAKEAGTTSAVVLAMAIELLEVKITKFRAPPDLT